MCLRRGPVEPWHFQLRIDDADGEHWLFRRNTRVRRLISELSAPASDLIGCSVLAPEIQLLYESRARRAKDEQDFAEVVGVLGRDRRAWLAEALKAQAPKHPWLDQL